MSVLSVIGYVRCSSMEQATDGWSIDAQRGRIEAWCQATGAHLDHVVADEGVSGTRPLGERPGGREIADLLASRRPSVDAVVVLRLDRLGRDAAETLTCLRRFTKGQLGLVSIADRVDLSTPHGRAMAGVAAIFSELERALIAERTADALRELRNQGRVYGPIPFGYRSHQDRLVEEPGEQEVIRRIRRLRARGLSYQKVAQALNTRKIPAKRGGRWHSTAVRSVILTSKRLATAA